MTEHGIHLGESLVAPFIQVGGRVEKGRLQGRRNRWMLGCLISKRDITVLHVDTLPWLTLIQDWLEHFSLCSVSPGLMITSALLYHVLHFFHITIDIRNVCVFLAPLFSSFTAIVTYHFTKELKVKRTTTWTWRNIVCGYKLSMKC